MVKLFIENLEAILKTILSILVILTPIFLYVVYKVVKRIEMAEIINRTCSDCGKEITIEITEDGKYVGGHYFGLVEVDNEDGETMTPDEFDKWVNSDYFPRTLKTIEHWECDDCFNKESD